MAKEEQSLLGRKLEQWREEEGVMRSSVERNRFGLVGVLRQGEDDACGLQQRIKVCVLLSSCFLPLIYLELCQLLLQLRNVHQFITYIMLNTNVHFCFYFHLLYV